MRRLSSFLLVLFTMFSGVGAAAAVPGVASMHATALAASVNVLDHGVVGDGVRDDTAAIQAVLDNAPPGATIRFPDVSPGFYRVSGYVRVEKPVTIQGNGPTSGSEFRQMQENTRTIDIRSSGVTVDGIRVIGYEYGSKNEEQGIAANYRVEGRLSNITIRNNWVENVSGMGISLHFVDDFIVSGNHVEDAHYAGIYGASVSRGLISGNNVVDVGDPEVGSAFHNSYPIVLSANPSSPLCSDVIIRDNVVRESPIWTGIMNHGGVRILIMDNEVYDADFLYANTWTGDRPSHDTSFINNYGENGPRNALWSLGPDGELTVGVRIIGNQFRNSSYMYTWNSGDGVITWNEMSGTATYEGNALRLMQTTRNTVVANNAFSGASVSYEGDYAGPPSSSVPPAPGNLFALRSGDGVKLSWDYSQGDTHDSFYIEQRVSGGSWERTAFRPPNDANWRFDAPTNPHWVRFDPLSHTLSGLDPNESYEFRIRANNGDKTSGWTVSQVAAPARFEDVPFGDTFYSDIEWLAGASIGRGCNPPANTNFCPNDIVTRGQMAAFLVRALDLTEGTGTDSFNDDGESVFEKDINGLAAAGIARGCNPPANDRFCPYDGVTRGQMAAFLHRALGGSIATGSPIAFSDDDGSIFEPSIEWLASTGITRGCNPPANSRFCPDQAVTRGQMAAFLHRALG